MDNQFPDTIFVSRGRLSDLVREEVSRHRLTELAGAVREHEERTQGHGLGRRPYDEALYRRARRIAGEGQAKAA